MQTCLFCLYDQSQRADCKPSTETQPDVKRGACGWSRLWPTHIPSEMEEGCEHLIHLWYLGGCRMCLASRNAENITFQATQEHKHDFLQC